jgi:2-haloacid dehalogenase
MKYEIIIFDADDTLFDYSKSELFALENAFQEYSIACNSHLHESYKMINQQLWNEYEKGDISLSKLRVERFIRLCNMYSLDVDASQISTTYIKYLGEGSFIIDGATELCNYLLTNGYRLAIISNGIKEVQLSRIQRSELSQVFEQVIVSEDTGYQKPHSGIFDYAFSKLKIQDKDRVMIVGDSISSDIQGGINYGIDTCWFNPSGKINKYDIKPHFEIRKLEDLVRVLEGEKNVI